MRAWWLDMLSPRNEKEQELFDLITETVGAPPSGGNTLGPTEDVRLTDEEYLGVFDDLVVRYNRLARAYRWGMVRATTPEQEQQLAELRGLLDE